MHDEKKQITSFVDVILAFTIGLALLLALNYRSFIKFISNDPITSDVVASDIGYTVNGFLSSIDEFAITPILITILFWMGVGAIVYKLTTLAVSAANEIIQDVDISLRFRHPTQFKQSSFWLSVVTKLLFTFFVGFVFISWIVIGIKFIIPFSQASVQMGLIVESNIDKIQLIGASLAVLSLFSFGLIILTRLLFSLELNRGVD